MYCQKCGKIIPDGTGKVIDGQLHCAACANLLTRRYCQRCGREVFPDTAPQPSGKLLCADCARLPDDSGNDRAFWNPKPRTSLGKLLCADCAKLPVWMAGLVLVIVVGAVAALFGTKTLCFHEWTPATCQAAEYCPKCGRSHGDPLPHKWKEATCTEPRTCMVCGETEGEPLGHNWLNATCTAPRTCLLCGETEGEPAGHTWQPADCQNPKTCSVCGAQEGKPGAHKWTAATCTEPMTCTVCGLTEGEPLGHDWTDATCTEPMTCTVCGETEGEPAGHQWKAATILAPKTCTVCGETEGEPLSLSKMRPVDLMDTTKGDFIGAVGDAHHEEIGCEQCSASRSTLVSAKFPGCVFAFGDSADSFPTHIHVFEGNITKNTSIGMTYAQLTETLGKPSWYLNEADRTAVARYTISGQTVGFVFTDKKLLDDITRSAARGRTEVTISDTSAKVAAARIG